MSRAVVEEAVLDVADQRRSAEPALSIVLAATQRRLTTAARLQTALRHRARHRWRALLMDVVAEVRAGVASPLERRYAREVEGAHHLPGGVRNTPEKAAGASLYRDVRYPEYGLIVELDGRTAHPRDEAFRDFRRDNRATAAGEAVLRYGWADVTARPCAVAGQVARTLAHLGWTGRQIRCGPACSLP